MRSYGQFCPIARASELLAERWTPIILRNLLLGCSTFGQLAAGAPGLSRALLTKRLRELERAGIIEIEPKPDGHGSLYILTPAGRDLWGVVNSMGGWAQKWLEVTPAHADPDLILWSWVSTFLRRDMLPEGRVLVRFDFPGQATWRKRCWLLVEDGEVEICPNDPGFAEDLVVLVSEPLTFARWHLGEVEWSAALRSGDIQVIGSPELAKALPRWNSGPDKHAHMRREAKRVPNIRRPYVERDDRGTATAGSPSRHPHSAGGLPIPGFEGRLIQPWDEGFDEARSVWNGAIDRYPLVVARCLGPSDVAAALTCAREHNLPFSIRGGGHGVAGSAVCDDGIVIDLSGLKRISVDPTTSFAEAQAGVRWGELDAATQAFGLATTGGTMSRTGISGLTIGGGIGWLMRLHGLTIDNLVSADMVTAEGEVITVSQDETPDLFWAIRGGGGNFGVVTSFTYRLHQIGSDVLAGPVVWALEDAPEMLRKYREFIDAAPREMSTVAAIRKAPAAPFLPVELHRRLVLIVAMVWVGDPDDGEKAMEPLRSAGRPLLDLVAIRPYTELQRMFDAGNPDGHHYYWKSVVFDELAEKTIDTIVEQASRVESPMSYAALFHLGGAVTDIGEDDTAYSHRHARHTLNINAVWAPTQPIGEREVAWARGFHAATQPFGAGAYLNFLDHDDTHLIPTVYGKDKLRRLAEAKRAYDPDNVFRSSHNIQPALRPAAGSASAARSP